jgi:hypothetical protein
MRSALLSVNEYVMVRLCREGKRMAVYGERLNPFYRILDSSIPDFGELVVVQNVMI